MVYMVADNDLDYYSSLNINQLEAAIDPAQVDIYVYLDRSQSYYPSAPVILKIMPDDTDEIFSPIVMSFSEQNSASDEILRKFISFVSSFSYSERKALILWSHGYGWFSSMDVLFPKMINSRYFIGIDESNSGPHYLDIPSIASAIDDNFFDIIIADACEVADIEVAYELKDKTNYFIASQVEVLGEGMPYASYIEIMQNSNNPEDVSVKVANAFFEHYNNKENPVYRSAAVSVTNTKNIEDVIDKYIQLLLKYNFSNSEKMIAIENSQKTTRTNALKQYRIDMRDYINNLSITMEDMRIFDDSYKNAVVFSKNTPFLLNAMELKYINGLNMFVPTDNSAPTILEDYKKLKISQKFLGISLPE